MQLYSGDVLSIYLHAFVVSTDVKNSAHMWTVRTEWLMEGEYREFLGGGGRSAIDKGSCS